MQRLPSDLIDCKTLLNDVCPSSARGQTQLPACMQIVAAFAVLHPYCCWSGAALWPTLGADCLL
jgi:hypothetical protein